MIRQQKILQIIRKAAKAKGLDVVVNNHRGKGSHITVSVGDRRTIVASKVKEPIVKLLLKQLNLGD